LSINTTRLALPTATGTDLVANYPSIDAAAKAILDTAAVWHKNTLANRPAANTVVDGYIFEATDTGVIYISDGSNWHEYESAFSTYKTITEREAAGSSLTAVTYVIARTGLATAPAWDAGAFYFDPADWSAGSRTTNLRIRAAVAVNAVAPTVSFTIKLFPVQSVGGASGANATIGSVGLGPSGSSVTVTTPSASTQTAVASADFAAPSAGFYVLGVTPSGSQAANSFVAVRAELQMRQT